MWFTLSRHDWQPLLTTCQVGSMYWKAPPPIPERAVYWACPAGGMLDCCNVLLPLLWADIPDQELELEVRDTSEGNFLEWSILICSCTLLTHIDTTSPPLSLRRNSCSYKHNISPLCYLKQWTITLYPVIVDPLPPNPFFTLWLFTLYGC